MILPLSAQAIMEFLASVSIHKRKVSSGGVSSTFAISVLTNVLKYLTLYFSRFLIFVLVSSDPKVGQLKQTGEMSVQEGKQLITFDGYHFLAYCARSKEVKKFYEAITLLIHFCYHDGI